MGGTRPTIRPIVFALAHVGVISQYIKKLVEQYITQVICIYDVSAWRI